MRLCVIIYIGKKFYKCKFYNFMKLIFNARGIVGVRMSASELKAKIDNNTIDMKDVGTIFFSDGFSNADKKTIIECFLASGRYEDLASVIHCGMISKQYHENSFNAHTTDFANINSLYFMKLEEICKASGVKSEDLIPLAVASLYAKQDTRLRGWVSGCKLYIENEALRDYEQCLMVVLETDYDYKAFSSMLKADCNKTIDFLVDQLLNGRNIKKMSIRKFLFSKNIPMLAKMSELYQSQDIKIRSEVVRLLVLYKNDPFVSKFLANVLQFDKSKSVRKIVESSNNSQHIIQFNDETFYRLDDNFNCILDFCDDEISGEIIIDSELNVKSSVSGKLSRESKKFVSYVRSQVESDLESKILEFENMMIYGATMEMQEFKEIIEIDPLSLVVASTLFFTVYKDGHMHEVVVVDEGVINDIDNEKFEVFEGAMIGVLHRIEIPKSYKFIKELNVKQPFNQIRRREFYPSSYEFNSNIIERLNGVTFLAGKLKGNFKKYGFKILNRDEDGYTSMAGVVIGSIICVLSFTKTDFKNKNEMINLLNAKFFDTKDVIKLRGQTYINNVPLISISQIKEKQFSEFMHLLFKVGNKLI